MKLYSGCFLIKWGGGMENTELLCNSVFQIFLVILSNLLCYYMIPSFAKVIK